MTFPDTSKKVEPDECISAHLLICGVIEYRKYASTPSMATSDWNPWFVHADLRNMAADPIPARLVKRMVLYAGSMVAEHAL